MTFEFRICIPGLRRWRKFFPRTRTSCSPARSKDNHLICSVLPRCGKRNKLCWIQFFKENCTAKSVPLAIVQGWSELGQLDVVILCFVPVFALHLDHLLGGYSFVNFCNLLKIQLSDEVSYSILEPSWSSESCLRNRSPYSKLVDDVQDCTTNDEVPGEAQTPHTRCRTRDSWGFECMDCNFLLSPLIWTVQQNLNVKLFLWQSRPLVSVKSTQGWWSDLPSY